MIPTRNARLLNASIYLVLLVLVGIGLFTWPGSLTRVAGSLLCVAFGLVHTFGYRSLTTPRRIAAYFAGQAVVTLGLIALAPRSDTFNLPFFVLAVQAMLALPLRPAALLIAGFYLASSLMVLWSRGASGSISVLFNAGVFFFTGVFGLALRQAETARLENERLLEELRASQRQVRDLAVFEERNRLARDLHDSAKQRAFALSAQLDAVRSLLHRDPQAAETHLLRAEQVADHLRQELANLILELRPPEMQHGGLPAALQRYAAEWSQQCNIPVDVQVQGDPPLPPEVEQALFRVAQEALANVARHSRAPHVDVALSCVDGLVSLTIADSGSGFDPAHARSGVGTRSMQERMARLPNGKLTLDSEPGRGTRVTAQCAM